MWKKPDSIDKPPMPEAPRAAALPKPEPKIARIGGSLSIQGDLYGEEDLFIEGRIEGKIRVNKASVTIGESGRVHADIEATNIRVAGEVKGDLIGRDQVVLLETGNVEGDIKARSVTLENGARFKGSIDMDAAETGKSKAPVPLPERKTNGSAHSTAAPTSTGR